MTPDYVYVIDTSSLIELEKGGLSRAEARDACKLMTRLVKEGRLVWPPQVETELTEYGGDPDLPAKWVLDNVTGKRSPAFESVRRVMAEAGEVVDQKKEKEDADPYVLGLGVESQARDSRVLVVTNDYRDKRGRISMVTACERLELPTMRFKSFLRIAASTE